MGESKKKSRSMATQRAWSLVRMALLWGRKGGIFKRWHMFELRNLFSKHLKALNHHNNVGNDRYLTRYGEKQLSFDETPIFNVKMHRPTSMRFLLPCIARPADFDYDFELDSTQDDTDDVRSYGYYDGSCNEKCDRSANDDQEEEEEKGVDVRAEEFIAKFYEQMKLQRQISYLQYKEHNDVV
ncbi:hypothetical protein AtNW77_Chr5g0120571 [Arabidopsis thaliana]|uniref:Cotton fiber protein n=2 Tax=Arabidopsis TaxID=3701 RepID=A0A178UHJ9_ARATH|nr:hypothetical protein ISN45_At05g033040 [Arabidopsis thaliana x Arabidopsis arenosa]OAO93100.1 hypothetical protein AXX17_AT5G36050 [Arabidopsis thaliana]